MTSALRTALRSSGISRVVLVRHGNTNKHEIDAQRTLTDKGLRQCHLFRQHHASALEGVSLVLASAAERTMQTAREIISVPPTPVDDLYFVRPWRTEQMIAADSAIGYAPVAEYIERFPGVHDAAGQAMAGAVAAAVAQAPPCHGGALLICGHSGYLSFLALEVVRAMAPDGGAGDAWASEARNVVLHVNQGEASAFELDAASGAKYLPNPEATDFGVAASNDAFVVGASGGSGS